MTITAAAYTGELPTLSNVTENVPTISAVEVQQKRITELAYYKDEKRGFGP